MRTENGKTIWRVLSLSINENKAIVQIDEKLPKHFSNLSSISVHIIPSSGSINPIPQCGELSLSLNNAKEPVLHTTTAWCNKLAQTIEQSFPINAMLETNARISGYYRDFGFMKNESQEFIPYAVKMILECKETLENE